MKKAVDLTPALISMDIGNGYVKYKSASGRDGYLSAVGEVSDALDFRMLHSSASSRILRFEGKLIAVGDTAYYEGMSQQVIRDTSRYDTPYYRQLFASALASSIAPNPDGQPVEVVLSLPPGKYFDREHLKAVLAGAYKLEVMQGDGTFKEGVYNVPIALMRVIPEGMGSVCMVVLDEKGYERPDTTLHQIKVGVVDIGTLTTDLIMLDGLRIVRDGCVTSEQAIYSVIHKRLMMLASRQGVTVPDYRCDAFVQQGFFSVKGEHFVFEDQLAQWWTDLAQIVNGLILQHWHSGNDVDVILLTGGAASHVYAELRKLHPHVRLASDNQNDLFMGNAEGGYRYGLLRRMGEAAK